MSTDPNPELAGEVESPTPSTPPSEPEPHSPEPPNEEPGEATQPSSEPSTGDTPASPPDTTSLDTAEHFTAELLKDKAADLAIGESALSERFVNPTLSGEWPRGRDLDYEPSHRGPEPDEVGYEGRR